MKSFRKALTATLLLLSITSAIAIVRPARAQPGTVCITDPATTDCSLAPTSFSSGSTLTVAVNIDSSDAFNGFDIAIQTDPARLQPVSNDLSGNILGSGTIVLANTDSGFAGFARVAVVAFQAVPAPATGRLFTVAYNVVGATSLVPISFATGCSNTSSPGECVTIALGVTPQSESILEGIFTGSPDFAISADLNPTTTGQTGTDIIVQSLNGLSGTATLSTVVLPAVANAPTVDYNTTSLIIQPNGMNASHLELIPSDLTPVQTYTAVVTGTMNGVSHSVSVTFLFHRVSVHTFFTLSGNVPPPIPPPLPVDSNGNPFVNVVLANMNVSSTNPGEVDAWVNATNTGTLTLQSIQIQETLPLNWVLNPPLNQSQGGAHAYYRFMNGTIVDITPKTVGHNVAGELSASDTNPQVLTLTLNILQLSLAKKNMAPGEGILLQAKLQYGLKGTLQHARNYPTLAMDTAVAGGGTLSFLTGFQSSSTLLASFITNAKVLGDVNGDFKIDIVDIATCAFAYGSKKNQNLWNPACDMNQDGVISILDIAIIAAYYGTNDW